MVITDDWERRMLMRDCLDAFIDRSWVAPWVCDTNRIVAYICSDAALPGVIVIKLESWVTPKLIFKHFDHPEIDD